MSQGRIRVKVAFTTSGESLEAFEAGTLEVAQSANVTGHWV